LAGSLKRELQSRGIKPKVHHAMGELEVLVDGRRVFSYKQVGRKPTVGELLAAMDVSGQ
jgi:hypothetical protein